jgi:hypothetical protein
MSCVTVQDELNCASGAAHALQRTRRRALALLDEAKANQTLCDPQTLLEMIEATLGGTGRT